jgi:hypothetical protein
MLGVVGLLLYGLQIPLLFRLLDDPTRVGRMLLAISFCWCLISWTTDMFEVAVANLFVGLAIGYAIARSDETSQGNNPALQLVTLADPR